LSINIQNPMRYRSKLSFLGIPLLHVAIGSVSEGAYHRGVATGWVALGDIAIGIFFSCGGVASGGISIGGASLGVLSVGGLAIGLVALGGLSMGVLALGGAAFAWYAAIGGLAIAHDYAIGGAAFAQRAVGPSSSAFQWQFPLRRAPFRTEDAIWLLAIVAVLLIFARFVQERRSRKK
jgi:hypothetical protein